MNAFTKVLVVLVLLLSVGFAASQIILYGKREKLGAALEDTRARLSAATQKVNDLSAQLADTQEKMDRTISDLRLANQTLESRLADKTQQANDLTDQLAQQTASVRQLTELSQSQLDSINNLKEQIAQLDAQGADLRAQIEAKVAEVQRLTDTIKDKNATIGELDQQLTEVKKENKRLADANEDMTAKLADLVRRGIQIEPEYAPAINGKVLEVDARLKTAVIDKGSLAGVKPNTEFTIYRDSQFVARMVITDVDKLVSVGHMVLLAEGQLPRQGDDATTQIR